MTVKLTCCASGRRLLACALASTILATTIGFAGLAEASERITLTPNSERSVLNSRTATNTGRSTSITQSSSSTARKPVYTMSNPRTANTPRKALSRTHGNTPRSGAPEGLESLSWSAPMTRADGSKLYPGEIEGYRIYYKTPNQKTFHTIDINDASLTSFQLEQFKSGVYEFSVTTLDTNGLESRRSPVISASL